MKGALTAPDGAPYDYFGSSVAFSGRTAVVGAPDDNVENNVDEGSAWVFVPVGVGWRCEPDVNQDGSVDQDDIADLINNIAGGPNSSGIDPDFNRDGNADQDDVMALVNVVAGGACP